MKRRIFSLGRVVCVLTLLWLGGFAVYLTDARRLVDQASSLATRENPPPTAIIVLTGGSDRIATGLDLLQRGLGKKLFISGAGAGAHLANLFAGMPRHSEFETCCITLGHQAGDTVGNARESLAWLNQEGFRRALLVTAHYHMRRSLVEFNRADPGQRIWIDPWPVVPPRVPLAGWWQRPATMKLLLAEYCKLLVALVHDGWERIL